MMIEITLFQKKSSLKQLLLLTKEHQIVSDITDIAFH